jgi:hypothetical protein
MSLLFSTDLWPRVILFIIVKPLGQSLVAWWHNIVDSNVSNVEIIWKVLKTNLNGSIDDTWQLISIFPIIKFEILKLDDTCHYIICQGITWFVLPVCRIVTRGNLKKNSNLITLIGYNYNGACGKIYVTHVDI